MFLLRCLFSWTEKPFVWLMQILFKDLFWQRSTINACKEWSSACGWKEPGSIWCCRSLWIHIDREKVSIYSNDAKSIGSTTFFICIIYVDWFHVFGNWFLALRGFLLSQGKALCFFLKFYSLLNWITLSVYNYKLESFSSH